MFLFTLNLTGFNHFNHLDCDLDCKQGDLENLNSERAISIVNMQSPFIITGDINIHLDMADDTHTQSFNEILQNFNLKQYVTAITHDKHTLDVFITPKDCTYTVDVSVSDSIALSQPHSV